MYVLKQYVILSQRSNLSRSLLGSEVRLSVSFITRAKGGFCLTVSTREKVGCSYPFMGYGYRSRRWSRTQITERVRLERTTLGHLVQVLLKQGNPRAHGSGLVQAVLEYLL